MVMYDEYIKYFDMFPELKKITDGFSVEPQDKKFVSWCKRLPGANDVMGETIKSIEIGITEIEKNLEDIDKKIGNITGNKKEKPINYAEFIVEKSDAGKLADRFTKLLEKK